jgi:hypothetical protein
LLGRPTLMAIRTAHVALLDLSKQLVALAPCSEKCDGFDLVFPISMVELKDERVALTAVDASMRAEILIERAT